MYLLFFLSSFFRLQEEFSNVQNKLTSDANDKKSVIQTMSKELEMHLRNFNKLKDELGKVSSCGFFTGLSSKNKKVNIGIWEYNIFDLLYKHCVK